ncbi:MAG: T9SS type A sorting domain-containing protein [Saprospiraceae bacterium]|nr:T9SS type A sorting domain-containing protein [Saprospiraceae bacterium]
MANVTAASTDLPAVVRPFCNSSGFNISASVTYLECTDIDVYVIVKARPKFESTRFIGNAADPARYFSNLVHADGQNSPELSEILTFGNSNSVLKVFRFRVSVTEESIERTLSLHFPIDFQPNWYFGEIPWRLYVHAEPAEPNVPPVFPEWELITPLNSPVSTLLFDAPYFPIVGSAKVSDLYDELTGYSIEDFAESAHSIMMLQDESGSFPVLTVDVQRFVIGFGNVADRGQIYLCPGAQIKVVDGDSLIVDVADMFTCGDVSKGILVETGGTLILRRPQFFDAELAVDAKRGSTLRSFAGTFANNYRGIRLDNTGTTGAELDVNFTSFNDFFGGNLKPGYTGMVPNSEDGYGMEILNHPFVTLQTGTFGLLNTGIRLVNSSLSLGDVKFGVIAIGANASAPWHGHAIWAWGSGVETLFFSPNTTGGADISDCERRGVYANRMNVTLNNISTQANSGFFLENCRMNTVRIINNPMDCRFTGIRASKCLPLKMGSRIANNDITVTNPGNTAATGNGILLDDATQVTGTNAVGWKVVNNSIQLDRSRWGIRFWGGNQSEISENDVTFASQNQYPHYLGFDLLNANNMTLNCNNVYGFFSASRKGYFIKNVSQSEYTCNDAFSTSTGMEFSAMCDATVLKGSSFSGGTGLFLNGDVALGTQGLDYFDNGTPVLVDDHGNKWSNSSAFHAAITQDVVNYSRFGVDPVEDSQFKPSANWQNWFLDEITPTIPSFSCAGFSCLPPGQASTAPGKELERAIADGSIHSSGLPGMIPKMLENHLYTRLQENPSWASETVFQQFEQSKTGTSTAAFWAIRQGINAFHNRPTNEQNEVEAKESDIVALSAELAELDSTRNAGTAVDEALYAQTLAQLASKSDSLRNILTDIRAQRQADAAQLLTQNAAISVNDAWEHTERKVNDMEIRMFLQGDTLYAAQLATLDSIGSLCLHTNGEAVLRAQVLYNLFLEKEYTPVNCAGEREDLIKKVAEFSLRIFPNPTSGFVSFSGIDASGYMAEVYDVAGLKLVSAVISGNSLDLSNLPSGIYHLRLTSPGGGVAANSKIVISK